MTAVLILPAAPALASVGTDPSATAQGSAHARGRDAREHRQLTSAVASASSAKVRLVAELASAGSSRSVAAAGHQAGGRVVHEVPQALLVSFEVPRAAEAKVRDALARHSGVRKVELAVPRQFSYTPNDLDPHQTTYLSAIDAPLAWETAKGSSTVKIAVVDSGVDVNHPDLSTKIVGKYNAMAGALSTTDVTDDVGHGTFVAGVAAAATNNAAGVAGVGFNSSILAVKVGDETGAYPDDVAAGVAWATDQGAKVINLSLGSHESSSVESNAMSYAQSHGAVVVAAAGNDGGTADAQTPNYPAAYPGVIAVGATDAGGNRATFSSYGSWVSVAAPGVSIYSTVPTAGSLFWPAPTSGYESDNGTSFSSPIVAGEVALFAAAAPTATVAQLKSAVLNSAHGYSGLGLGHGQVDLDGGLALLPPSTTPSLTAPADAALVGGSVPLAATSTAAQVQFLVDGVAAGPRSTVSSSTAQLDWPSWGTVDGPHVITATDCNAYGCGAASAGRTVTVQNPAPVISSPATDATVAGVVGIDVTTQAPKVQLSVDGVPTGALVTPSVGAAHLTWASGGWSNGTHTLSVAACTSTTACGSSSSVPVSLQNAAPAITSPAVGQLVSGAFTLGATAASGALQFLVDGNQVGFDTTSPYSATVNFSTVADGTHVLKVQPCNATKSQCSGPATTRSITVKSLHPSITRAMPAVFSPNGDKRADTTTLTYYLPGTESVWWGVKNGSGTVVRGPYYLGTLVKGSHSFLWNGNLANGTRAPNATYTAYITTKATSGSSTLYGSATRYVRVDTVAPTLSVSGLVTGFYPYPDGYRDTVVAKATTNEPGLLTLAVRNSSGRVVRNVTVNHSYTGTYNLTWNGRDSGGHLVPAGTYRLQVTSQDVALNRRSSSLYNVVVSLKKLVGTTVSKVVTPAAALTQTYIGSCSAIHVTPQWTGGFEYLSDYYACGQYDGPDLAASEEHFTLPGAVKYANISVTATGEEDLPGYGDTAAAFYLYPNGDPYGNGVLLGASYGTRSIGGAPTSILYGGRTLHWVVGTVDGSYYDVRAFTVHYTYYVLK